MNSCFFDSPFFHYDLDGFSGLNLINEPAKNTDLLNCCRGSGCLMLPTGIKRCDLDKRFLATTKLLAEYKAVNGKSFTKTLTENQNSFVRQWLGDRKTGFAIKMPEEGPSCLWEIAAMAAWRQSLRVRVISFKNFKEADLYSGETDLNVLFIEGVDKLWLPEKALEFSLLIDFSFNHCIPLWISLVQSKDEIARESQSRMQKLYRKKLSQIKHDRPTLEWLEESSQGKLKEQTSGWQIFT